MDLSCCQLKPSASRKYRNFSAPRDVYNFVKIKNQYNFIIVNNSLNIFPEKFRKDEKVWRSYLERFGSYSTF